MEAEQTKMGLPQEVAISTEDKKEAVKEVSPESLSTESPVEASKEINDSEEGFESEGKPDLPKKVSLSDKLFGDEKVEIPADYNIEFPEGVPEEERSFVKEQFVKSGMSKENAQLLTNSLTKVFQANGERMEKELNLKCDQDILRLKKEYGPENFKQLQNKVHGVVKELGLKGETFDMFLSTIGAYDAFKFLDKVTSSSRDVGYAPPASSQKGVSSSKTLSEKYFETPEFKERFHKQAPEALREIKEWAEQQTKNKQ